MSAESSSVPSLKTECAFEKSIPSDDVFQKYKLGLLEQENDKEMHKQRLRNLKEQLKLLSSDDWKFTPSDKLIGLM